MAQKAQGTGQGMDREQQQGGQGQRQQQQDGNGQRQQRSVGGDTDYGRAGDRDDIGDVNRSGPSQTR